MTNKEIRKELEKTYKEMGRWPRLNSSLKGPVPKNEVERRETVLKLQQILYRIQDARKERNKSEENFNLAFYYLLKSMY